MDMEVMKKQMKYYIQRRDYDRAIDTLIEDFDLDDQGDVIDTILTTGIHTKDTALDDIHEQMLNYDQFDYHYDLPKFIESYDQAIVQIHDEYLNNKFLSLNYENNTINIKPIDEGDCLTAFMKVVLAYDDIIEIKNI